MVKLIKHGSIYIDATNVLIDMIASIFLCGYFKGGVLISAGLTMGGNELPSLPSTKLPAMVSIISRCIIYNFLSVWCKC